MKATNSLIMLVIFCACAMGLATSAYASQEEDEKNQQAKFLEEARALLKRQEVLLKRLEAGLLKYEKREVKEYKEKESEDVATSAAMTPQQQASAARSLHIRLHFDIVERIKNNTKKPKRLLSRVLSSEVLIHLEPTGELAAIPEITYPSFPEYEESIIQAVLKSAPFPMPTESFILNNAELLAPFLKYELEIVL